MSAPSVHVGTKLPELALYGDPTFIVSTAIATRDYFPGHHDLDAARALGSPHIFMNILTTTALVQRYVEQWAGTDCRFKAIKIKLGVPNYPGDTMTFSGEVRSIDAAARSAEIALEGRNSMGNHVSGSVRVVLG